MVIYFSGWVHLCETFASTQTGVGALREIPRIPLLRSQGLADMHMIYMDAMLERFEYYEAHIPEDFKEIPEESFDRSYMNKLYTQTYKQAVYGYPWQRTPPNFLKSCWFQEKRH